MLLPKGLTKIRLELLIYVNTVQASDPIDNVYLYLTNYNSRTLQKFNATDLSLIKKVTTDTNPNSIGISH